MFNISSLFSQENVTIVKEEFKNDKKHFFKAWQNIKYSDRQYEKQTSRGYLLALDFYLEAYEYNQTNPELNYKIGICFIASIYSYRSLPYLEIAYNKKPKVATDILWHLACAYHYNYMFDEAITKYTEYGETLKSSKLKNYTEKRDKRIKECELGKIFYNDPQNVLIINLTNINSIYPDYCPVISADESVLIFTSRREDVVGGKIDKGDGQYYEDIYISYNENNEWQLPYNMGRPLNSPYHDATVGLSPDGQSMLTYRNSDIYISQLNGNNWTEPEPLPKAINSKAVENSACFSYDAQTIYFIRGKTIDPKTSNGDIYFSTLKNGKWQRAEKLPDNINTKYEEDGVFMHPDGKTLYFSSKGHNSMGGYDIFKTVHQEDGTWSDPQNLGYPINTPSDDIYFVLSADGKTGYYSSAREDALGYTDIYKISFITPKPVLLDNEDNLISSNTKPTTETSLSEAANIETVMLTIVTGKIYDENTLLPIETEIEIFDNEKNTVVLRSNSNSETGKYLISLPSGKNYGMVIKANSYLFHTENFDLPETQTFQTVTKDIRLNKIEEGSKIVLKNISFDYDKSSLRDESIPELQSVINFLNENPKVEIEISGHTDNKGSHEYNQKLSENRAKAVVDYLISKNIDKNRLKYRGASFDEPIAPNETEKGRQLNRRVEFKILKTE